MTTSAVGQPTTIKTDRTDDAELASPSDEATIHVVERGWSTWLIPLAVCAVAMVVSPLRQLGGLAEIPGDITDARLNNYFLENIYQYLTGGSPSLWHYQFFHPFPYVIGFSDNLFGASPVYLAFRALGVGPHTSFQLWFLAGYVANFAACYYALRKLRTSVAGATLGAVIFAFALPTTAHSMHVQLHYRVGVPLAIVALLTYLDHRQLRSLLVAGAWLTWQFVSGVYMGFFTAFLMGAIVVMHVGYAAVTKEASPFRSLLPASSTGGNSSSNRSGQTLRAGAALAGMLGVMGALFYPYIQVSSLYQAKRTWEQTAVTVPRFQSYFLADDSTIWSFRDAAVFDGIPLRWEHQMFVGAVPLLLAAVGFFAGWRRPRPSGGPSRIDTRLRTMVLLVGATVVLIALTIYLGRFSPWRLIQPLPLASAIRVITRFDQVLLFPLAVLAAYGVDELRRRVPRWPQLAVGVVLALLLAEASLTTMHSSAKADWYARAEALDAQIDGDVAPGDVLFFAQGPGPFHINELDAMWVALERGAPTINGYSGNYPPGFAYEYGGDCAELQRRIDAYRSFAMAHELDVNAIDETNVHTVGLNGC